MPDGSQLTPLQFNVLTPGMKDDIEATMARNEARKLPDATPVKSCVIVGSGPSAATEALWGRLKQEPDTITVALNGALHLFIDRGIAPTYWACCDPQELTLDFVKGLKLPRTTLYLLATKCPESLFDYLESRNLNVQRWRIDDFPIKDPSKLHVPCAVSISLVAQSLMRFKGFHRFEHYGWDCCYVDGQHHASNQPAPDTTSDLTFTIETEDGQKLYEWPTNGSWMAELHDAGIQAFNLVTHGYKIVVRGNNAMAQLLHIKGLAEAPDADFTPALMLKLSNLLALKSASYRALARPIRLAA